MSKGWYEATDSILISRTILHFPKNHELVDEVGFMRKYKHLKIEDMEFDKVLTNMNVKDCLETLEFENCDILIEDFKKLRQFKTLKSLTIKKCTIDNVNEITAMDLVTGLQSLEVTVDEESLNLYKELIRVNSSIRTLRLRICSTETDINTDFLRNIHLPALQELLITSGGVNICLDDGLKPLFQKHKDLNSCVLIGLGTKDEVISVLRRSCTKLEKLSLEECE